LAKLVIKIIQHKSVGRSFSVETRFCQQHVCERKFTPAFLSDFKSAENVWIFGSFLNVF